MRLREKMGLKSNPRSRFSNASDDFGNLIVKRGLNGSKKANGHRNIGRYTQELWESLGERIPDKSNATANLHPRAGVGVDTASSNQPSGGSRREGGSQYWGTREGEGFPTARLVAFADTLRSGESALSPAVFDAEGGRRAEVRWGSEREGGGHSGWGLGVRSLLLYHEKKGTTDAHFDGVYSRAD